MHAVRSPESSVGISCNFCGATFARPYGARFGLCGDCVAAAVGWGSGEKDDETLLQFMARFLELRAKEYALGMVRIRCEAFAQHGFQCAGPAIYKRDGRDVCSSHFRTSAVSFSPQPELSEYARYGATLSQVAASDPDFLTMLRNTVDGFI